MKVDRLRWLGITPDHPEAMVGFLRDILGLRIEFSEPVATELSLKAALNRIGDSRIPAVAGGVYNWKPPAHSSGN